MTPTARTGDLLVRLIGDEALVYDLVRYKAHCLNEPALKVWRHCDGRQTPRQIARVFAEELGEDASENLVWLALDRLDRAHLLESPLGGKGRPSRREALAKLAKTGIVLPFVWSIVAPDALSAASGPCVSSCSGRPDGTCCSSAGACQTCGGGMCMGTANAAMCSMCGACP